MPLNPDFDTVLRTETAGAGFSGAAIQGGGEHASGGRLFESQLFKAKFVKMQFVKTGEVAVALDVYRTTAGKEVVLRLNDPANQYGYTEYFGSHEQAEAARRKRLQALPTVLHSSTGDEFRLVGVNGLGFVDPSARNLTSLSQTRATTITYYFKAADLKGVILATTTFTLDAEVRVFTRSEADSSNDSSYGENGTATIHLDGLR